MLSVLSPDNKVMLRTDDIALPRLSGTLNDIYRRHVSGSLPERAHGRDDAMRHPDGPGHLARVTGEHPDEVLEALEESHDPRYGGFGREVKEPEIDNMLLALWSKVFGLTDLSKAAVQSLRQIHLSPLHDPIDEGFFRRSRSRDWSKPDYEKLLSMNARLIQCYLAAHAETGLAWLLTAAREITGFLDSVLWQPRKSMYSGSVASDERYYSQDVAGRRAMRAPEVDSTLFCDHNAAAASSLFHLAWATGDNRFAQRARAVVDGLVRDMLDDSGGCFHYWPDGGSPRLKGYLSDQAHLILALGEAYQFTGEEDYTERMLACVRFSIENLLSGHGFVDIAISGDEVLHFMEEHIPVDLNSVMAQALCLASLLLDDDSYRQVAYQALDGLYVPGPDLLAGAPVALAAGIVRNPVSVTAGSNLSPLAAEAKTKFLPGLSLRYDKTPENRAIVSSPELKLQPVVTWQALDRDIRLAYLSLPAYPRRPARRNLSPRA